MKFLDKFSTIANRVAQNATELAESVSEKYKKEGFQGIVKTTEDGVNKAVDSTKNYFQEIGSSAKEAMTEAEKNVGKGTISGKVASGLVGTISVTQEVAGDVAKLSKRLLSPFTEGHPSEKETTKTPEKNTTLTVEAPLEKVLSEIMGAKNISTTANKNGKWQEPQSENIIQIANNSWYSPTSNIGGNDAVSLLAFHLTNITKRDHNNKSEQELIKKQAAQILVSYFEKKTKATPETKVVAAKKTTKTAAKKTPVARNEKQAVKEYENAGVVKKAVKKTTKKTEPVSKPEQAATKLHEKASKTAAKKTTKTVATKRVTRKP